MPNPLELARTHLAELREELEQAHVAYTAAAVTEIASFRAQLSGQQVG